MHGYLAKKVSILSLDRIGNVTSSWDEYCAFGVWCSEYDGQLHMIYPSSFPIDLWLSGSEPRVS
jgi:hypothetical protein